MTNIINVNFNFYFQPGVYKITNERTGKIYFGESQNLAIRLGQHFAALVVGNHWNGLLQQDWKLLEKTDFSWHIVEIGPDWSDSEKRVIKQDQLIDTFSPNVYNRTPQRFQKGQLPVSANAVIVNQTTFSSITEAASVTGVPFAKAVQMAEKKENGWSYADHETVLQRRKKYAGVSIQVSVKGVKFASISECARAHKVTPSTVTKRIASRNFPGWTLVGQEQAKKPLAMGHMGVCSVIIEGQLFESMQAAANFYNVHRNTVSNRCKSNNKKFEDWKFPPK